MKIKYLTIVMLTLAFVCLSLPHRADAVVAWSKQETDLVPGGTGAWDDKEIVSATVIKDGATYKMWYTGGRVSTGVYQIGYAESSNGINWTKHGAPVLSPGEDDQWDHAHVGLPSVIKDGSTYRMWYAGTNDHSLSSNFKIGYATSTDGIAWTRENSSNPVLSPGAVGDWDTSLDGATTVIGSIATGFEMYYIGYSGNIPAQFFGIGRATSTDGVSWIKYNDTSNDGNPPPNSFANSDPVIRMGPNWKNKRLGGPAVIKEESLYRMWFAGQALTSGNRIGYASSKNGYNWREYFGNPVVIEGAAGTFDSDDVQGQSVIKDGNTYKMWYVGRKNCSEDDCDTKIGYATASAYQGNTVTIHNAALLSNNTPGGLNITMGCVIGGPSPIDINEVKVEGPNGFSYVITDSDIKNLMGEQVYWTQILRNPVNTGVYTFTVKTNNGLTATKTRTLGGSAFSSGLQEGSSYLDRRVSDNTASQVYAGNATPTFKWKPYVGDSFYYRVRVSDWKSSATWYMSDYVLGSTKGGDGYMSVTVPSGILKANTPYKWVVDVGDSSDPYSAYNRATTINYDFYTGTLDTSSSPDYLPGSGNGGVDFVRENSLLYGDMTVSLAMVQNIAPWDIDVVPESANKFEVRDDQNNGICLFVTNSAWNSDVWYMDMWPFMYLGRRPPPFNLNLLDATYKFHVGNKVTTYYEEQFKTFTNAVPQPIILGAAMTPSPNSYLSDTSVSMSWPSQGVQQKYRAMIIDWNLNRTVYDSGFINGVTAGQTMNAFLPRGTLKGNNPYWYFVFVYDSTMNNRTMSQVVSFTTGPDQPPLYGNFGTGAGIWQWNGTVWSQITPNSPGAMAVAGPLLYGNFGTGAGIWKWDGILWSQVTPNAPIEMAASGSLLYGNFGAGAGIWKWDGSAWSQVTPNAPTAMAVAGPLLYGNFGTGAGIWKWDGASWSQVTPNAPIAMAATGSILYGNFSPGGIWKWDGSTWSQVTPNNPQSMAATGSLLYGFFTGAGIWKWDGSAWSQVTPNDPQNITVSGSILYGDFGTAGIWKWDSSAWSQITPNDPTSMIVDTAN